MLERIEEIETDAIEELGRIKRDQELLEDRLRMMQERKEGVSEVVFERVRGDYRTRLAALEDEARPHKERARREFAKLQALESEIRQGRDAVRLEKEELEFRHSLGEFPDEDFERRGAELAEAIDQREVELAGVESLRERFFAAVRSREELDHPAPPSTAEVPPGLPAPPVALAGAESAPSQLDSDAAPDAGTEEGRRLPPWAAAEAGANAPPPHLTPHLQIAAEGEPLLAGPATARTDDTPGAGGGIDDVELLAAPGESGAADLDSGRTSLLDTGAHAAEGGEDRTEWDAAGAMGAPPADPGADDWHEAPTGGFVVPPPPPPGPAPAAAADEEGELSGATRILSRPRLLERGDAGDREHVLALGRTSIGRASDNLVHLLDEAVSRHHAEIVPGPSGYLLRDLGSENGIFVNGERTPEHVLHEGDVIQIGARTLVYRGA
jgi:hypothetical protein